MRGRPLGEAVRSVKWVGKISCSGYINFTSVYIAWLCGAMFLHLPSFASLGIDFKTDLSLLLTVFLFSLLVSHLYGVHTRAAACSVYIGVPSCPIENGRRACNLLDLSA